VAKTVDNGSNPDYDVATGAGAVSDDVQRVTLASDDPAVAKLGTIDTDTGNIATSAATLAGAVSGTELQVDVVTMPTATVQDGGGSLTVDAPVGTPVFVRLSDGASAITALPITDNSGSLTVDNAGTFAVQPAGSVAHDAAGTGVNPLLIGGYSSAAAPTSVSADGEAVRAWFLRNGAQATVVTAAGALIGGDATNGLDVDVTRVIPGTTATALGKAEDAVHANGDTGVMALAVRTDTSASRAGADGDYIPLTTDAAGRLWVNVGTYNTAAVTSVADTATSTTLLSAAGTRRGFRITNTSSAVLYVKYGTTASATDFTVRLPQWAYLEESFYSGRVDGIWSSDPGDGAALITSLSA
jgi:hypothetical protein